LNYIFDSKAKKCVTSIFIVVIRKKDYSNCHISGCCVY